VYTYINAHIYVLTMAQV